KLELEMAAPDLYEAANKTHLQELLQKQSTLQQTLSNTEENRLQVQGEMESRQQETGRRRYRLSGATFSNSNYQTPWPKRWPRSSNLVRVRNSGRSQKLPVGERFLKPSAICICSNIWSAYCCQSVAKCNTPPTTSLALTA